jgi:hypothetical protein
MKLNHLVISAVLVIALVAFSGVASAAEVKSPVITHVQVHGNYNGIPTIINAGYWGYNYQMVPTSYTVTYLDFSINETGDVKTELVPPVLTLAPFANPPVSHGSSAELK